MKIDYTERVLDALEDAPIAVRKAFRKQLHFLAENLHHPSLRAKKYDEAHDVWQARVTQGWVQTVVVETYICPGLTPAPLELTQRRSAGVSAWSMKSRIVRMRTLPYVANRSKSLSSVTI